MIWRQLSEHNSRARKLMSLVRLYAYLRTYKSDVLFLAHSRIKPLRDQIARRLAIDTTDLPYLISLEIGDLLSAEIKADRDLIQTRRAGFGVFLAEGRLTIASGDFSDGSEAPRMLSTSTNLSGTTASKGRARGAVHIIRDSSDISLVKRGDIVVTGMTTPNMTPALERAAGIVTDEGGILCHAAIISRELHIPCIIDTKIATQVLDNGQMVCVIAEEESGNVVIGDESST